MENEVGSIHYKISEVIDGDFWGSIKVEIEGKLLLKLRNYPLSELSRQLTDWADRVDDSQQAMCFIFHSENSDYLGTFRIEPRPQKWEFTSWKEKRRPPRLLELEEYKSIVQKFICELSNETMDIN
ncbi:hypothetical protein QSV34_02130 [Porticoccus sp. W117]|uniref:DUF7878 domain-containing protein n=1 Tax=Porticoccus sp. W117 TaxID=3054777 RepID=UPI0025931253|nr:hypothetical protein [Porticoccus sp. W117]MDM3870147.1 hypothetical protein [Porticoccus sp. W117]